MSEKELFKLTPIRPEFNGKKIKGALYSFGGYSSPDGEMRLGTQYLQDRLTIQQNKEFKISDPLGNFWENAVIRIQLKGIKIPNDNLIKLVFKFNTPKKSVVQIYHGIMKLKEDQVEGLAFIELEVEPFKGDNYFHVRTLKRGSILHFYELVGYLI
ncbi:MAG: hypothetical protein FK733_11665 [Asgard group archaeon]|nr:hypothetical protein [Asgard group archaeon]